MSDPNVSAPPSLEVRLTTYRNSLRRTADDIERLLGSIRDIPAKSPADHDARISLKATVDLHRHMADDLTKIIAGHELRHWAITGEVPDE